MTHLQIDAYEMKGEAFIEFSNRDDSRTYEVAVPTAHLVDLIDTLARIDEAPGVVMPGAVNEMFSADPEQYAEDLTNTIGNYVDTHWALDWDGPGNEFGGSEGFVDELAEATRAFIATWVQDHLDNGVIELLEDDEACS